MDIYQILAYLMMTILCYWLFKFLSIVYHMFRCFVFTRFGFTLNLRKFGQWAVVTGSTDGIGKAYAEELAKLGFDIVLISRTTEKLKVVAHHIETTYKVKTKIITFDFSTPDGYEVIEEEVKDLDVGVLVNNVGTSGPPGKFFEGHEIKTLLDVAYTNMFGEINVTHTVLKGMIERKRGVIVHISSSFGFFASGLMNLYTPTKAFVNAFVKSLQLETEVMPDIYHQLVTPQFVCTNMINKYVKQSVFIPSAATYVSSAIKTIGISEHTYGYWMHELFGYFFIPLPRFLIELTPMMSYFKYNRRRKRLMANKKVN